MVLGERFQVLHVVVLLLGAERLEDDREDLLGHPQSRGRGTGQGDKDPLGRCEDVAHLLLAHGVD